MNYYITDDYCASIFYLSQRGRHLFKLLSWSVVDSKLFPAQNPMCYPDLGKPTANFGIIIAALKETRHQKLQDAIPVLNRIIREGKMGIVRSGIIGTIQRWLISLLMLQQLYISFVIRTFTSSPRCQ
jgi:hypothetical protein